MTYTVKVDHRKVYVNGVRCRSLHDIDDDCCSGGFRWIFLTPDDKILKMDFTPSYGDRDPLYRQTEAEVQLYNVISVRDRRHFPKILASGVRGRNLWWLIEERLKIDGKARLTKAQAALARQLKKKYSIGDIYPRVGKNTNFNWGVTIRGRVVIWDFGCNRFNCGNDYD